MTCADLDEILMTALALGNLEDAAQRAATEEHVTRCERCRRSLDALRAAAAAIGAQLPAVVPPPALRERLLASASAPGRHALADLVARTFDLDLAGARRALDLADEPARWRPGPLPGMARLSFAPGPRLAGARAELLRFAPGAVFPRHGHRGAEVVVVLEGGFTADDGAHHGAGERLEAAPGARHGFRCDATGCLVASLLTGELVMEA